MIIYCDGYQLKMDLDQFILCLTDDAKLRVIHDLSCQDVVVKHVIDLVLHGETAKGRKAHTGDPTVEPYLPVDQARRSLLENAEEAAKREVERLQDKVSKQQDRIQELENYLIEQEHKLDNIQ